MTHLELGPLSVSPHGVGIAVGFLAGAWLMLPAARRRAIADEHVHSMLTRAILGAIVGARLAYVVNHFDQYLDDPLEILAVWEGGISLLGGIAGGVLAGATAMRPLGLSFWRVMDAAVPGLALGIAIGRVGDLVVADHLGKPADFFLGYRCPPADIDTASRCIAPVGQAVHQPALYDLVAAALILAVLLMIRRRPHYDGFLTLVFAVLYGLGRFAQDFFRIDVTHGTGLTGSQWTALVVAAVALWWLVSKRRTPWASGRGEHASTPGGSPVGWDAPGRPAGTNMPPAGGHQ